MKTFPTLAEARNAPEVFHIEVTETGYIAYQRGDALPERLIPKPAPDAPELTLESLDARLRALEDRAR